MEGFVIQMVPDDSELPIVYWNGNGAGLEDLNQANLYPEIAIARIEAGQIQGIYTGYAVETVPAIKGIVLKHNVAPSSTSTTISPTT